MTEDFYTLWHHPTNNVLASGPLAEVEAYLEELLRLNPAADRTDFDISPDVPEDD